MNVHQNAVEIGGKHLVHLLGQAASAKEGLAGRRTRRWC